MKHKCLFRTFVGKDPDYVDKRRLRKERIPVLAQQRTIPPFLAGDIIIMAGDPETCACSKRRKLLLVVLLCRRVCCLNYLFYWH